MLQAAAPGKGEDVGPAEGEHVMADAASSDEEAEAGTPLKPTKRSEAQVRLNLSHGLPLHYGLERHSSTHCHCLLARSVQQITACS